MLSWWGLVCFSSEKEGDKIRHFDESRYGHWIAPNGDHVPINASMEHGDYAKKITGQRLYDRMFKKGYVRQVSFHNYPDPGRGVGELRESGIEFSKHGMPLAKQHIKEMLKLGVPVLTDVHHYGKKIKTFEQSSSRKSIKNGTDFNSFLEEHGG